MEISFAPAFSECSLRIGVVPARKIMGCFLGAFQEGKDSGFAAWAKGAEIVQNLGTNANLTRGCTNALVALHRDSGVHTFKIPFKTLGLRIEFP